ncbi:hypothetical protein Taro_042650 [Colocasia esculenta]|uniref:Uncharacterized protein n=1 Tax=Colocasia esculenta TaxID=4460 RepID=A0A843WZ07_COLES|nr:hypothetical protein [Colocasia esculenta]
MVPRLASPSDSEKRTGWPASSRTPVILSVPDQPRELYKRLNAAILTTVFPSTQESVTRKSFFSCTSSVGSAPLPSTASFSPEIPFDSHVFPLERMACNFWRWSKIWKAPFGRQKASSGSKSFFSCTSSVGSAPLPSTASFSPKIPFDSHVLPLERMACNFWRWSKIWKAPFGRQKASYGSDCVDTLDLIWQLSLLKSGTSVDTTIECTHRARKPELCLLLAVDSPFLAVDRYYVDSNFCTLSCPNPC